MQKGAAQPQYIQNPFVVFGSHQKYSPNLKGNLQVFDNKYILPIIKSASSPKLATACFPS